MHLLATPFVGQCDSTRVRRWFDVQARAEISSLSNWLKRYSARRFVAIPLVETVFDRRHGVAADVIIAQVRLTFIEPFNWSK